MADNPGEDQGPALQFLRPDPPQPKLSQTPALPASLAQALDGAGLREASAAITQNIDFTVAYDCGAYFGMTITDEQYASAAFETWAAFDVAFDKLHSKLNFQCTANGELHARNNELQTLLNNQTAALASAMTKLTAAPAPAAAPSHCKNSTAKDPPPFSANDKDAVKRHEAFEHWRRQVKVRWSLDNHEFPTEYRKLTHITGLLSGSAYQSVRTSLETIMANEGDPTQWRWQTGDDLLAYLDTTYRTFDVAADAERKLSVLSQEDDFAIFTDFITEFTSLANRAGIDDATRVRYLREKANARIRKATMNQVPQPAKDDWPAWLKLYTSLATNVEWEEFHTKNKTTGNGGSNKDNAAPAKKDPDAMDLSSARVGGAGAQSNTPAPRISDQERQYRMDNNLCKRCGGADHYAAHCTPAHRAANPPRAIQPARGGGAPRGRGGGRGSFTPRGAPYNGGNYGGYNAQYQYPQHNQYPPPQHYGAHVRAIETDVPQQQPSRPQHFPKYDCNSYTPPTGYVVGEVHDENPGNQGKEHPPR